MSQHQISDINVVSFLRSKGCHHTEVVRHPRGKCEFVYEVDQQFRRTMNEWFSHGEIQGFIRAREEIHDIIFRDG